VKRIISVVAVLCAALGAAPSALAGTAACSGAATSQVFGPWSDPAQYQPFQGSSFESGASGWSWGGKANIVSGDDAHLVGSTGSHAVNLPASGTAKSRWICTDSSTPSLRFFVRRLSGTGSLTVMGQLAGSGGVSLTTFATITGSDAWAPSPVVAFPSSIMAALAGGSFNAQFQFVADPGTVYRIDDVFLDPYKTV
jgi:hypothetical protein